MQLYYIIILYSAAFSTSLFVRLSVCLQYGLQLKIKICTEISKILESWLVIGPCIKLKFLSQILSFYLKEYFVIFCRFLRNGFQSLSCK